MHACMRVESVRVVLQGVPQGAAHRIDRFKLERKHTPFNARTLCPPHAFSPPLSSHCRHSHSVPNHPCAAMPRSRLVTSRIPAWVGSSQRNTIHRRCYGHRRMCRKIDRSRACPTIVGLSHAALVLGEYRPRGPGACMPHCCYTVQVPRDTVHLRLTGGSIIAHVRETFVAAVCNVQRAPCHIQQTACERARSNLRRLDCAAFPMRGLTPSPGSAHRTVVSCNPCLLASARAWRASLCVCVRARRARVAKGFTSGGSGQH